LPDGWKDQGLDDVIPLFARYQGADLLVAGDGNTPRTARVAKGIDRVKFLGRIDSGSWTATATTPWR
jgi:hypothetical protein